MSAWLVCQNRGRFCTRTATRVLAPILNPPICPNRCTNVSPSFLPSAFCRLSSVLCPLFSAFCLRSSALCRLIPRMRFGAQAHYKGNLLMVLASVAAIAAASGAVWGLSRTDTGLTNIESATQDVATDLLAVS